MTFLKELEGITLKRRTTSKICDSYRFDQKSKE